ncbi:zinc dependent phospholipase C family protein [Solitalea sp. MAHUQ-68]|uniref:Zinc dependent phospholipase C family protein n=1 Tax=Solitalea agri TaxID=2953739 RepID=A0A9X2F0A2_9SPHI|nr:zinc dependent phospholipase C family protein [Solitalea agri]MCO4291754.1 zinc dependent phospholipase C family protein [Solitalea agri]
MRFRIISIVFVLLFLPLITAKASRKWGFWSHMQINRMAVFTLPEEMLGFFKRNIDYITKHAVDPDKLRYLLKDEAPKHYIDLDLYPQLLTQTKLRQWNEAVTCYSIDTLQQNGVLPWNIERVMKRLTKAFMVRDSAAILRYATFLGHYVADASVPLHTTSNYNGLKTNQKGIHAFWETRLPVMFAESYDQLTGRAVYIDKADEYTWQLILQSHSAVDSVLDFESKLNKATPAERKFGLISKNGAVVSDYSDEYSTIYHTQLNGMVERRMRAAIYSIGSFWYTAWVNAGQPDLNNWVRTINVPETDSLAVSKLKLKVREEE